MRQFVESDVIWLDTIDSTNNEIKRMYESLNKTTWVLAGLQTDGRGRNGNIWFSSRGNFSGSVIFFPTLERNYFHLYGFFFGVALHNTIKKFVKDDVDVRLKWPNDLMIENGKAAGILLESFQTADNRKIGLIVGVGVNLNSSPKLTTTSGKRYDTQCVANFTNHKIDQMNFFNNFNRELIALGSSVEETDLSSILTFWQSRSYDKGTIIEVSDNRGQIKKGTFLGVDEIGGLIFGENTGVKKIYSGDVYFGS